MFKPGQSGNPGGRPKGAMAIRYKALAFCEEGIDILMKIARDENAPHTARIAAIDKVMDRALGKAIAVNASVDEMKEYDRMSSKELKRMIIEQFGPEILELHAQALAPGNGDEPELTHVVADGTAPKRDQSD